MKLIILMITLLALTLTHPRLIMAETSSMQMDRETINRITPVDLILMVLNDSEFLALEPQQQLHILKAMYDILESSYKSLKITKRSQ